MTSPIYRSPATSPPYPSSSVLPNPKKRPSLSVSSHAPASKRRKPTNASQSSTPATSHPLRQTSFPPEESAIDTGERSPSVESNITGHQSLMTAGTGKPKPKKRGRKKKTEETSVISGGKVAAADAASAVGQAADEAEEEEDDADADEGILGGEQDKQQKRKEKADLALLIEHFNDDQLRRYEAMRRNKFRKETVRRIVNQTLSQSVPPSVVTGISGYTKLLMGLLIERARDVQEQNAIAAAAYPSPPSRPQSSKTAVTSQPKGVSTQETTLPSSFESSTTLAHDGPLASSSFDTHHAHPDPDSDPDRPPEINHNDIFGTSSSPPQPPASPLPLDISKSNLKSFQPSHQHIPIDPVISSSPLSAQNTTSLLQKDAMPSNVNKPGNLGPLVPDDLREAVRRYKRSSESAGVGQGAMSLMGIGVQGSSAAGRGRGRRLFG
ncbi:MAG: hypothetical protein Q9222_005248 [Ikaeria aurantiellina]